MSGIKMQYAAIQRTFNVLKAFRVKFYTISMHQQQVRRHFSSTFTLLSVNVGAAKRKYSQSASGQGNTNRCSASASIEPFEVTVITDAQRI